MALSHKTWTQREILDEFLRLVLRDCYKWASETAEAFREEALDDDHDRLKERIINLEIAVLADVFSIIDGASGPSDWPGIKLVNAGTRESLSTNLQMDLSRIESEFIGAQDVSPDKPG